MEFYKIQIQLKNSNSINQMKRKFIISTVLVALALLFALLKDVFGASIYFSLACLIALSAYLACEILYSYYVSFFLNFEERFEYYLANLVNSSNITSQDVEMGRETLKKKYKKSLRKEKLYELAKLILVVMIMVTAIVAIIRH